MVKYVFQIISFILISNNSFCQLVSNVFVKQVDDQIILTYDLQKNVTRIKVSFSRFSNEFELLTTITGGEPLRAGKLKQITFSPELVYCNGCIFRIEAIDEKLTDFRDNQKYNTVIINNKFWMADNLNYTPKSGRYSCPGLSAEGCRQYGKLYDWETAQNVCPSGWRLPSKNDWNELIESLGTEAIKKIQSPVNWNGSANLSIGFNANPAGFVFPSYDNSSLVKPLEAAEFEKKGYWWSSFQDRNFGGYFYVYDNELGVFTLSKSFHASIRCIRDIN